METSSPSAQGVDAAGIGALLDVIEAHPGIDPHGVIIQRHGHRIVEGYWAPHTADRTRLVYSLSKSFTGTALALQLGEGRLMLDDLVSEHLPDMFDDEIPEATRRMRIRHIASMATGHDHETLLEALVLDGADPVNGFLHIAPDAEPGTVFAYNQPPVLTLATILERLAGESLVDYLRPRLLDPLGVADFRWTHAPTGVSLGFSGVYTNLDAVARLGQLYLDDGTWGGRRLLPEGWVTDASSVHIPNVGTSDDLDWQQGYGFQLWTSRHGFRGDGAYGQYMVVLPEHDAVVAMFSCTDQMQTVLDAMWEHLLPAMGDGGSRSADAALAERLSTLEVPTAARRVGGGAPEVPSMTFERRPDTASHSTVTGIDTTGSAMTVHEDDRTFEVPLTEGWTVVDSWLAASATSRGDGTAAVHLAFTETPHRIEIELHPADGTFVAHWPLVPFGAGRDNHLSSMHAP